MAREYAYCRRCKRRHRLVGWNGYIRDDSVKCPKLGYYILAMRHVRTGKPMPV